MPSGVFYPATATDTGFWAPTLSTLHQSGWGGFLEFGKYTDYPCKMFLRFQGVDIPRGSSISSARIRLVSPAALSGVICNASIACVSADSSASPTTVSEAESFPLTTATAWAGISAWGADSSIQTPDIAASIQPVINRAGWSPGNSLVVVVVDDGSDANAYRHARSYASGSGYTELTVEWSMPVVATPEPATGSFFALPPITSWCAEVDAWTDFPSEWSDEETAWQPVSETVSAGSALAAITRNNAQAVSSAVADPAAAAMTVAALDATVTTATSAAVTVAVSSVAATLDAMDASAVPLAVLLTAAAVLESAALDAESLAGTSASPDAATLGLTPLPVTVSTTIVVVAQVASVAVALSALAPSTTSAATAEPATAGLAASARDAIGAALARIEVAAATMAMVAQTVGATSSSTATPETAVLGAILGAYEANPVAIVAPDAATAALVAQACEFLADTTAGPVAAILRLAAQAAVAGTGIKEVVRLASPITTSARRAALFNTSWRGSSRITPVVRFKSRIEVEQT